MCKGVTGKYTDGVCLYPTVMYFDRYSVGHPSNTVRVLIIYAKKKQLGSTKH